MKKIVHVLLWTALLLTVSFVFIQSNEASAKEFNDVPKTHPNYTAIQEMQQAGYINGYPDGNFLPNEPVSRKHVASLLDQVLKLPKPATDKLVFVDVQKNHPYYKPIMKLYNEGIVSGGLDGEFNPNASITRIQMAKMLDIGFDFNMMKSSQFEDLNMFHWGYLHASALYSNGVTKGDFGNFHPNQSVTRAHYAEFLHRAMKVENPAKNHIVKKEQALNMVNRLPHTLEMIRIQGKKDNKTYSQIRPNILPYATERFTDGLLKADYPNVYAVGDSFLFPHMTIELDIRFTYNQLDATTLKVHTILLNTPGPMSGGGFVNYMFKNESGMWKVHDYTYSAIGKKNFELTKDEAKRIVENFYSYDDATTYTVTYKSTASVTAKDPVTKEAYQFNQYKFAVNTLIGSETVTVNSSDGSLN